MNEINFNCPKCGGAEESIVLEKRSIIGTKVDIGKERNKYYSLLAMDDEKYNGDHIPVNSIYEQYIFICTSCDEEYLYSESSAFDEINEELDNNKLKELGLIK
jgi:predicted RNA-binding Zn-ribbon protein involved in translation (DUF1610 family)